MNNFPILFMPSTFDRLSGLLVFLNCLYEGQDLGFGNTNTVPLPPKVSFYNIFKYKIIKTLSYLKLKLNFILSIYYFST